MSLFLSYNPNPTFRNSAVRQYKTIVPLPMGTFGNSSDSTRFHLRAVCQIATLTLLEGVSSTEDVENLIKQLEVGLPVDVLDLLRTPIPLTRGEYLALYQANINTLEELWSVPVDRLKEILDPKRVAELNGYRLSSK